MPPENRPLPAHRPIGLGDDCATAFQLRRVTGVTETGVLDWVYTPAETLERLIRSDFAGFFARDNLRIRDNGDGVEDITGGIIFQHDFTRDPEAGITPAILEREYEPVARRYRYLIGRFVEIAAECDAFLFARATRGDDRTAGRLLATLRDRFAGKEIRLLFYRRGLPHVVVRTGPIVICDVRGDAGPAPEYWKGDDANWDRAFAAVDPGYVRRDLDEAAD
jgi:hypothetical protein